jgi:hypothetical protein
MDLLVSKWGDWGSALGEHFKKRGRVHFYVVKVHGGSGGIVSRCGLFTPVCIEQKR